MCLILSTAACDQIFMLDRDLAADSGEIDAPFADLDGDGLNDLAGDACIAPPGDATANSDSDPVLNGDDPCPFNSGTTSGDDDLDGIYNACDPQTNTSGDRSRCVMVFTSVSLNQALWLPRAEEMGWTTTAGELSAYPSGIATAIAASSLEGETSTTYHAVTEFHPHGQPGSMTLWLRASPDGPSLTDIGCRLVAEAGGTYGGVVGPAGVVDPKPFTVLEAPNSLRLRGSVITSGSTVRVLCSFVLNGVTPVYSMADVPLPAGRAGFTTDRWDVKVRGLHVLDHP